VNRAIIRSLRRIAITIVLIAAAFVMRGAARQAPASDASTLAAIAAEVIAPSRPKSLTVQHFVDEIEHTKEFLARVRALDPAGLSRDLAIDRRLLEGMLAARVVEQERIRRWRLDPLIYLSSTRALLAIFDDDMVFEDPGSHVQATLAALHAIPAELKSGQANLTLYVPRFRDQGIAITAAATAIFQSDLPALAEMLPAENPALVAAAAYARQSMLEWSNFLGAHLPKRVLGYYAIGIPAYDALLEGRHLATYTSIELYHFVEAAFEETLAQLDAAANEIDPDQSWLDILRDDAAPESPPPPITPRAAIDAAQSRLEAMDLPSPPWEQRIELVPLPASPLNRVYYPASLGAIATDEDGTLVSHWWSNPKDPTATEFLGPDDGAVVSVTAFTAVADHLLGLYQLHNASALRRAARSSMTAEGWALYTEQRASEAGAFPRDRERLRHLQIRLWRIARIIVDVGLHTDRLTEKEAATLLTDRVGLPPGAAGMEIDEAANFPGTHLGYMGFVELQRIRDDLEKERGASFSLMDFHKRLLESGPLPPALLRALLIGT
jgi:hypothetical protein